MLETIEPIFSNKSDPLTFFKKNKTSNKNPITKYISENNL